MKGKWAAGIPPRNFTWVIKDRLAMSERPGGFAPNHRKVRRQEEIIWLQVQGFNRVVSLLPSSHNLQAYEEKSLASVHYPLPRRATSAGCSPTSTGTSTVGWHAGERILVHQEELGDRVSGVIAGYLLWSDRLPTGPQAVTVLEHLTGPPDGPVRAASWWPTPASWPRPPPRTSRHQPRRDGPGPAAGRPDRAARAAGASGTHGVLAEEQAGPSPSRSTST